VLPGDHGLGAALGCVPFYRSTAPGGEMPMDASGTIDVSKFEEISTLDGSYADAALEAIRDNRPALYPAPIERDWGTFVVLPDPNFDPIFYCDTDRGNRWRTLRGEEGWYDDAYATGSPFSALTVKEDKTVYKLWGWSTYDGVIDDNR